MAETKTTKKTVKQTAETPQQQLATKRADLAEARKSLAAGELVNPRVIKQYKKDIARILTTINAEKESK